MLYAPLALGHCVGESVADTELLDEALSVARAEGEALTLAEEQALRDCMPEMLGDAERESEPLAHTVTLPQGVGVPLHSPVLVPLALEVSEGHDVVEGVTLGVEEVHGVPLTLLEALGEGEVKGERVALWQPVVLGDAVVALEALGVNVAATEPVCDALTRGEAVAVLHPV